MSYWPPRLSREPSIYRWIEENGWLINFSLLLKVVLLRLTATLWFKFLNGIVSGGGGQSKAPPAANEVTSRLFEIPASLVAAFRRMMDSIRSRSTYVFRDKGQLEKFVLFATRTHTHLLLYLDLYAFYSPSTSLLRSSRLRFGSSRKSHRLRAKGNFKLARCTYECMKYALEIV